MEAELREISRSLETMKNELALFNAQFENHELKDMERFNHAQDLVTKVGERVGQIETHLTFYRGGLWMLVVGVPAAVAALASVLNFFHTLAK